MGGQLIGLRSSESSVVGPLLNIHLGIFKMPFVVQHYDTHEHKLKTIPSTRLYITLCGSSVNIYLYAITFCCGYMPTALIRFRIMISIVSLILVNSGATIGIYRNSFIPGGVGTWDFSN